MEGNGVFWLGIMPLLVNLTPMAKIDYNYEQLSVAHFV